MSISEEYLAIKIGGQFYEKHKSEILLANPGEEVEVWWLEKIASTKKGAEVVRVRIEEIDG